MEIVTRQVYNPACEVFKGLNDIVELVDSIKPSEVNHSTMGALNKLGEVLKSHIKVNFSPAVELTLPLSTRGACNSAINM